MSVTHPVKEVDTDQNLPGQQKTTSHPLQKETDHSFQNFHANLMNKGGKEEDPEQKKSRMLAMKRRMAKPV